MAPLAAATLSGMALLPAQPLAGGTNHLFYEGPVAPGDTFDLTGWSEWIRKDHNFDTQVRVLFKALEASVTNANGLVIIKDSEGLPIELGMTIEGSGQARVEIKHRHTVTR